LKNPKKIQDLLLKIIQEVIQGIILQRSPEEGLLRSNSIE